MSMLTNNRSTPSSATLISNHQFKADRLSFANESVKLMRNPTLKLRTQGLKDMIYSVDLFDASWLGGRVSTTKAAIQPKQLNTLAIKLQDLQLSDLVALAKAPALKVTGKMSGKANITLDLTSPSSQGFVLADADMFSSKAGSIEYNPNDIDSNDVSLEAKYLQQILSKFNFQSLSAKLRLNQDEQLELLTKIKGSNPQFEEGKSVDFSLTLNPKLH